ncbi:MAG: cell division protein ZipA [Pseudomonadales bacterium]|nr:cell division protein ZipA [Pseudomonadales bacterium]
MRDWLLFLGPVFIVGVLIHGYWRMRSNRNSLKMALDKQFLTSRRDIVEDDSDDIDLYRAELPNGGARVINGNSRPAGEPAQRSLDLDGNVPVLMEPVEVDTASQGFSAAEVQEAVPEIRVTDDDADVVSTRAATADTAAQKRGQESQQPPAPASEETATQQPAPPAQPASASTAPAGPRPKPGCPEKYIVLYVVADKVFTGPDLLSQIAQHQMEFGDMEIYHRMGSDGYSLFSLVNAVEPGTFDPATMSDLTTPAISIFMRAHEVNDPLAVYEEMVGVAQTIALELGGEVRDESKSVLTPQTMEHERQELKEFVFRHFTG